LNGRVFTPTDIIGLDQLDEFWARIDNENLDQRVLMLPEAFQELLQREDAIYMKAIKSS